MLVSPAILWTLIFLNLFWQMLLPMILGNLVLFMADVIAHVALFCGRCYTTSRCCNLFYMVVVMFCVGPHPIYEADGYWLCFCLGMGHWPLWIELLLLLWWGSGPPFQLWWNCWWWLYDLRCYIGHKLERGTSGVLWNSCKGFLQILQCTFPHTHHHYIYISIWLHFCW